MDDNFLVDDENTCEVCGAVDGEGCPNCRSCGGFYQPGTEECDWCPDEDICAEVFIKEIE